ncbi:hypothetical protein V6N11_067405 [Hibiscus sabdariffa]|uniref:Uncharacterized protein n=1 Tax=Hibiscus sabdariffa TaxID=183260 RepID=A0ABR2SRK2_9ROSI
MRTGVPRIVAKDDLPAAWLKWSKVTRARSWVVLRQSPWLMIRALVTHARLSLLKKEAGFFIVFILVTLRD